MRGFEGVLFATVLLALLAGVFALIYKGSRPLQPLPQHPTPPRKAIWAALVPVVCVAILFGTFRFLGWYLSDHLQMPRVAALPLILVGVIAPWAVGVYSAYRAARAANKLLRAIGSIEVLVFILAAAVPMLVR